MEHASHTLQQIMAQAFARVPAAERPAVAWEFAAGQAVAAKTKVIACSEKTLVVQVPDATWRAQLMAMAPQFLSHIRQFAPIERIEFQLARPQEVKRTQ